MNRNSKIILGVAILIFLTVAFGGQSAQDTKEEAAPKAPAPKPEPVSFEEQLQDEVMDTDADMFDEVDVAYYESVQHVSVTLIEENPLTENHLRKSLAHATFAAMEAITQHPDKVSSVDFVGNTPIMDSKGNEAMTIVYRAEANMSDVTDVNWKELQNVADREKYLEPNFAYVWWHPALRV